MPFPSTFSTIPRPAASDRLNNPSHSALHNTTSSALGQVEAVIGLASSAIGTIIGDLRNAASNGGGHVQTPPKGGTGQTTFTKGDLLVGINTSTIGKLAVGTSDGNVLQVDSSVASGIKWAAPAFGTKVANSASLVSVTVSSLAAGAADSSILSVTVPGSTLGTSGAVRLTVYVNDMKFNTNPSVLVRAVYGNSSIAAMVLHPGNQSGSVRGTLRLDVIANAATNSQKGIFTVNLGSKSTTSIQGAFNAQQLGIDAVAVATSAENSTANKPIGFTGRGGAGTQPEDGYVTISGYTVEKIT